MREYSCETLIIGAGLAGATLGFLLRQAGKDVLMLELLDAKEKDKLCGGLMTGRTVLQFDEIFGQGSFDTLSPMRRDIILKRYDGYELQEKADLCALPRKRMDDCALDRYLASEGRLLDRIAVRGIDDEAGIAAFDDMRSGERVTIRFKRLVGADGAASATRRLLTGRHQSLRGTLEGVVPLYGRDVILDFHESGIGYSWYIPQGERAVVGCGFDLSEKEDKPAIMRESMHAFCRRMQIEVPQTLRGAVLPAGDDVLLRTGRRTFFIGDAAGLIHGFLGAGIQYALYSARVLAQSILEDTFYEETMKPCKEAVEDIGSMVYMQQIFTKFRIKSEGTPIDNSL